jgi:tetratricopeptide (TPR) repeat protein
MPGLAPASSFRIVLAAALLAHGQWALSPALAGQQGAAAPRRNTESGEELNKALAPEPPPEVLRKQKLDQLFERLRNAPKPEAAEQIALSIERLWLQTSSDTANLLMQRAAASVDAQKFPQALALLDKLVLLGPDWAEAWNQRAAVKLMTGDLDGAMADFKEVIRLEPHHFGALTGMGLILQKEGLDERARDAFTKALAIYPLAPEIQKLLEKPTPKAEGQDL